MKRVLWGLAFSVGLAGAGVAQAATLYTNNFESGLAGAGISGVTSIFAVPTAGTSAGRYYLAPLSAGSSSTLTVATGGAASVTIGFDLYTLNSVDGSTPGNPGPDFFTLKVNGNTVFNETFASSPGWVQTFGGIGSPPGVYAAGTGSDPLLQGVFGLEFFGPSRGYHLSFTTAVSGPSVTFGFFGNSDQGWSDEGFGIDNIKVTGIASGVPEPSTWAMMLIGFAGLGVAARRRKLASA